MNNEQKNESQCFSKALADLGSTQKLHFTLENALNRDVPGVENSQSFLAHQALTEMISQNPTGDSRQFPFLASNGVRITYSLSPSSEEFTAQLKALAEQHFPGITQPQAVVGTGSTTSPAFHPQ